MARFGCNRSCALSSRVNRRGLRLARGGRARLFKSSPYHPNSPYAASKAASDHLVRSFVLTYGMPALITNCSNNYGPYQHPEDLIPLIIIHALEGKPMPIYGDGSNVRDWLHVADHCAALMSVIERGRVGETYNVGGGNERNNRDVVGLICEMIDAAFAADKSLAARFPSCPAASGASCRSLISYVTDRPGHDHRYAIDATKLATKLGYRCSVGFEIGLRQTIRWYLDQEDWWRGVTSGAYRTWIDKNYGFRIAVSAAMRILVLNKDYLRFQAWPYKRQTALMPPMRPRWPLGMRACSGSRISIRRTLPRWATRRRKSTSTIPGCSQHGRASTACRSSRRSRPALPGARRLPAWLQRAVTPFKPMLRPLARKVGLSPRLDAQAEKILLAQIEDFRPDLVLNQDVFHVDTSLMRRIKEHRQPDPDRAGRDRTVARRGLDRLRSDDLAVAEDRCNRSGQLGVRCRSQSSRFRTVHSRRVARCTCAGYRRLLRRLRVG